MSRSPAFLDYDSIEELQKSLPNIRKYVRSIQCTLDLKEDLSTSEAVFTPFFGSLTYNYREDLPDGQIYSAESDCATLEGALQILAHSGVQQDLFIHIFPTFETRPFLSRESYFLLRDASLFKY